MRGRFHSAGALALLITAQAAIAGVVQTIPGFLATYPARKVTFGTDIGFPSTWVAIPPAKEYVLDYQVNFQEGWMWVKGGKLPGLTGGDHTSGCDKIVPDGWSARYMWREGGQGQLYLYHQNRRSGCGDEYDFGSPGHFQIGKWNRITQRIVVNTPGKADGIIQTWFNGEKKNDMSTVKLRGSVAENVALIDNVSLQTFYGGHDLSWTPSKDTKALFSEFHIRTDLPDFAKSFEEAYKPVGALDRVTRDGVSMPRSGWSLTHFGDGRIHRLARNGFHGRIDLFDARGTLVLSLDTERDGRAWDGRDAHGQAVRAGVVLVRLTATHLP